MKKAVKFTTDNIPSPRTFSTRHGYTVVDGAAFENEQFFRSTTPLAFSLRNKTHMNVYGYRSYPHVHVYELAANGGCCWARKDDGPWMMLGKWDHDLPVYTAIKQHFNLKARLVSLKGGRVHG